MSEVYSSMKDIPNYSSKILKAIRKCHRLTQGELADFLGITQGALSKIEADILELSAFQWVKICSHFKVPARSLITGRVEFSFFPKVHFHPYLLGQGSFKIPTNYCHSLGQSVRSTYPLLRLLGHEVGALGLRNYLEKSGFSEDYFTIMSNPLPINFMQDLFHELSQTKTLGPREVVASEGFRDSFDFLQEALEEMGPGKSFKYLLHSLNQYFQVDFLFSLENEQELYTISVKQAQHLQKIELTESFLDYLAKFDFVLIESLLKMANFPYKNIDQEESAEGKLYRIFR